MVSSTLIRAGIAVQGPLGRYMENLRKSMRAKSVSCLIFLLVFCRDVKKREKGPLEYFQPASKRLTCRLFGTKRYFYNSPLKAL